MESYWITYEGMLIGYEGFFEFDQRHGKGRLEFTNGEKFEGKFVEDRISG